MIRFAAAGAALVFCIAAGARAEDEPVFAYPRAFEDDSDDAWTGKPSLSIDADLELEFDRTYHPHSGRRNQLSFDNEVDLALRLTEGLSLKATVIMQPVRDDGGDQYFKDHAVFLQQLLATYSIDGFTVFAGKFNPRFGIAWSYAQGVYAEEYAQDYEVTERIGLGVAYTLKTPSLGTHRLEASTFFSDTTALSNSIITRPKFTDPFAERYGRNRKSYGGASNTESLDSFNVVLQGGGMPFLPELSYQIAYLNQKPGVDGTKREHGYSAGLAYNWFLSPNLSFHPLAEYVRLDNFGGNLLNESEGGEKRAADDDRKYLTLALRTQFLKNWNWTIAHTWRELRLDGVKQPMERLLSASVGYQFDSGLAIDVGWVRDESSGEIEKQLGFRIQYGLSF